MKRESFIKTKLKALQRIDNGEWVKFLLLNNKL